MNTTFFSRNAMRILIVVCFLTPFLLRGSRDALRDMRNDVKDWLPARFSETKEIEWFWDHFAGERFIIVTWAGCTGDESDEAFQLFKKKLLPSTPPSKRDLVAQEPPAMDVGSTWLERPYSFIGDRLGLHTVGNDHFNWAGHREKWLRGDDSRWYYITESGELYEFLGSDAPVVVGCRAVARFFGFNSFSSKLLTSFGPVDGPWYYNDPNRLQAQLFRSVVSGPDVLREMTSDQGSLRGKEQEALKRLKGSLFGPDGKQTAFVLTLSKAGLRDFHRSVGRGVLGKELGYLYRLASECGISMDQLHLGGPPVDNVAIDEEGSITLLRLVSLCVALGIGLAYLCFRSWAATFIVFLTGGISAVLAMSIVGWSGKGTDAVMMSMPALVYVLGVSAAVHFINYYRESVDEYGLVGAPERALGHAWKPAVLCNVTTAIGLASLYVSEIVPIKKFGIFAAAGVMGTLTLLFTYLPAALQLWPLNLPKHKRADGADSAFDAYLSSFWERFGRWIIRYHAPVAIGCSVLIAVVGFGVTRINTSVNLLDLFDRNAKVLQDYAWIEKHLGMLVPMEVVVKFAPRTMRPPISERDEDTPPNPEDRYRFSLLDRMETVQLVQQEIDEQFGDLGSQVVGRTMSIVTFSPPLPGPSESFTKRSAYNAALEDHRSEFLRSDYMAIDHSDDSELWRISLRVAAFKGVDYGDFVQELRDIVDPVIAAQNARQDLLRLLVEKQMRNQGATNVRPRFLSIAVVLPEQVLEAIKTPLGGRHQKSLPADKDKTKASIANVNAAPDERINSDNHPAQANPSRVRRDPLVTRQAVFARNLVKGLLSTRAKVRAFSSKSANIRQLNEEFDCVVTLGAIPAELQDVITRRSELQVDAGKYLPPESTKSKSHDQGVQQISAVYTGVVPIVYKAQRTLLVSLIQSTAWSFLTITPLMMLVSRSVSAGMVAMLPNTLPVLLIFGAMGWSNIRVDIGSMMTASIALGVAVDDTIHYLSWFKQELNRLGDRRQAIISAYRRCATPTFQAALISGLGLSIFAVSTFTPTQRFGYLMLTILFAGVMAELIFFPALLAGPLGTVFKPQKQHGATVDNDTNADVPTTLPIDFPTARKASA